MFRVPKCLRNYSSAHELEVSFDGKLLSLNCSCQESFVNEENKLFSMWFQLYNQHDDPSSYVDDRLHIYNISISINQKMNISCDCILAIKRAAGLEPITRKSCTCFCSPLSYCSLPLSGVSYSAFPPSKS